MLQQHAAFWDRNNDGRITPWETWQGLRELGLNVLVSAASVAVIHSLPPYLTQDSWLPDPSLSIWLKNIHKIKHGSDSGASMEKNCMSVCPAAAVSSCSRLQPAAPNQCAVSLELRDAPPAHYYATDCSTNSFTHLDAPNDAHQRRTMRSGASCRSASRTCCRRSTARARAD